MVLFNIGIFITSLVFLTAGLSLFANSFAQKSIIELEQESSITGKVVDTDSKSLKCNTGKNIPISILYFEATIDEGTGNLIGDWKLVPASGDKAATGQIIGGSINDNQYQLNTVIDKWLKTLCSTDTIGSIVTVTGQCGVQGSIKFVSENGSHYEAQAIVECN